MATEHKMYGWYSAKQQNDIGKCHRYESSIGEIIEVTTVSESGIKRPTPYPDMYRDMYLVGEVKEYIETVPTDLFRYLKYQVSKIFKWR